ncbi:MAG: ATP-binding protein [Candidatus Omnitrophota bacterium]
MGQRLLTDILNEMNNLALSEDRTERLMKWALEAVPDVIESDAAGLILVRHDTAVMECISALGETTEFIGAFRTRVKAEVEARHGRGELIWQEPAFLSIDGASDPADREAAETGIKSFHVQPLETKDAVLGYVALASHRENFFVKYKLNMLGAFSDQLALGIRSLLDRNIVAEQARMLAEEKKNVEEAKLKLEAIVGGMREGLVLTDRDGNMISINESARESLGVKPGNGSKLAIEYIIGELLKTNAGTNGDASDKRDIALRYPVTCVMRISTTPIYDNERRLLGRATVLTDVTKEKEIDRMKSEFVNAVSHELRTPLTSMREAVSLITEEVTGPVNDKQKRCLDVVARDVERLTRMINDLLDLSAIEAGKTRMRRTCINVERAVDYVIELLSAKAAQCGIRLSNDIPESIPAVLADNDKLIQMLTNLAGNGMKFTPRGGSVCVSACTETGVSPRYGAVDYVKFTVSDTGPGISKEDQARLFQKFSRLDTQAVHKAGGTGLGLVITKELVKMHGGRIWVESEPGRGASFCFTMPVFSKYLIYCDTLQEEMEKAAGIVGKAAVIVFSGADQAGLEEIVRREITGRPGAVIPYEASHVIAVIEGNSQKAAEFAGTVKAELNGQASYETVIYPDDGALGSELLAKGMGKNKNISGDMGK